MRLGLSDARALGMDVEMAQLYVLAANPPTEPRVPHNRNDVTAGEMKLVATRRKSIQP